MTHAGQDAKITNVRAAALLDKDTASGIATSTGVDMQGYDRVAFDIAGLRRPHHGRVVVADLPQRDLRVVEDGFDRHGEERFAVAIALLLLRLDHDDGRVAVRELLLGRLGPRRLGLRDARRDEADRHDEEQQREESSRQGSLPLPAERVTGRQQTTWMGTSRPVTCG